MGGVDVHHVNLHTKKDLLSEYHNITLEQVKAFSGWFMGRDNSALKLSTDMVIRALDPDVGGNLGLVNVRKIRLCQLSRALHFMFKNAILRSSYTSFMPTDFTYSDEATGRSIVCGLILLKLSLDIMKPQVVVDHRVKETEMEGLTLAACGNNIRTYLTQIQERRIELDTLRKDSYDMQRFMTLLFEALEESSCEDFLTDVKYQKLEWIRHPLTFNMAQMIIDLTALYNNYVVSKVWDRPKKNAQDKKILALTTALEKVTRDLSNKGSSGTTKPTKQGSTPGGASQSTTTTNVWRFVKKGGHATDSKGVKYVWCQHHGTKNENGICAGMYMPAPHDHAAWLKNRQKKREAFREKLKARKEAKKRAAAEADAGKTQERPQKKLALSKALKSVLATNAMFSDGKQTT